MDYENPFSYLDQFASDKLTELGGGSRGEAASTGYAPKFDYVASSFDSSTYNVKGLSYPEDLMDNPSYGQNRAIFYINVSVDSRVLKNGTEVAVVEGVPRDLRGKLIGQKVSTAQAGVVTTGLGAATGALGGSIVGGKGGIGALIGGLLGGGGTAAIAGSTNNQEVPPGQEKEPTFTRPQKRLQTAIALYIPNQLNTRYSVNWQEEDTFAFSAFTKGAGELGRGLDMDSKTTGVAAEVLAALAVSSDKVPFGKEQGVAAGIAQNPKKEQAFKNVDFRTFTFEYQFAPKSESEAENVLNIIRAFKYHMHPEFKSTDSFLYIYPSEFDITYYKGSQENLNIHRHTSCVLTEMNVNYTPNGVFATFPNGMPTQISMTLTFKELQNLSKETIEKYT